MRRSTQRAEYTRQQNDEKVKLENVTVIHDSPSCKAILVQTEEHGDIWIPRSQLYSLEKCEDRKQTGKDTIVISQWIAKQKGLL